MALGRIPELLDQRMPLERLLDDGALDAATAPVDQAHLAEPSGVSGCDVLLDDRADVARRERMQIEHVLDRNPVDHLDG
jgi:hypothetical protein